MLSVLLPSCGNGCAWSSAKRREHRENLLAKIGLRPIQFAGRELRGRHDGDALLGERGHELFVPAAELILHERGNDRVDAAQLLARPQAVHARLVDSAFDLLDEPGHADFEKLVEIGAEDRQETYALQQRVARILGLFEHPAVEGQPAQLAVEVGRLARRRGRYDRRRNQRRRTAQAGGSRPTGGGFARALGHTVSQAEGGTAPGGAASIRAK